MGKTHPIVDFGAHYYPTIPDNIISKHEAIEAFDGSPICTDTNAIIERYREAGIDEVVLSQPLYLGSSDLKGTRRANDELLGEITSTEQFYGLAAIPVAAGGESAAEEFERCLDMGYNGGALETQTEGVDLIDTSLESVFQVANDRGAPILVHPDTSDQVQRWNKSSGNADRWELNPIFYTELSLATTICKVLHEGIYDRYPELNLVFHHNGGNIASIFSRIELWINRAHRTRGEHIKTFEEFSDQFTNRVYVDTSGYFGGTAPFRTTFERLPSSQVLLATDFPYETIASETFQKIMGTMKELRPKNESRDVLGGNAKRLLVNT